MYGYSRGVQFRLMKRGVSQNAYEFEQLQALA